MKTDVIILNAGSSKRMQYPKMLLPFNNNYTFIEHTINTYSHIQSNIYIVISPDNLNLLLKTTTQQYIIDKNIRFIINHNTHSEKIDSVILGLKETKSKYIFIQNIDHPFITKSLLINMINKCAPNAYVKPIFNNKGGHPVLIHCSIKNDILKHTHFLSSKLNVILKKYSLIPIEIKSEKILANINSPSDYLKYFLK